MTAGGTSRHYDIPMYLNSKLLPTETFVFETMAFYVPEILPGCGCSLSGLYPRPGAAFVLFLFRKVDAKQVLGPRDCRFLEVVVLVGVTGQVLEQEAYQVLDGADTLFVFFYLCL